MEISVERGLLDAMLDFAREQHPHEIILLLRGKVDKDSIRIEDFLVPPLMKAGTSFAEFPIHMLPIDFSIVGTAHSHPSGSLKPSVGDLNNFYSRVMVVLANPYSRSYIVALNKKGLNLQIRIED